MIILKTRREIEIMKKAGRLVAQSHELVRKNIKPGVTTKELDRLVDDFLKSQNAIPTFKGYNGFPFSICASVNEEVVHGFPSDRELREGDIISVDIGATFEGYVGDSAKTFLVGEVDEEKKHLVEATKQCFYEGIKYAKASYRLSDISHAIQAYAESQGLSVVRDYVGHGVGKKMHESPQVPNFGKPNKGPRLQEGMVLAIEPMINAGVYNVKVLENNWTVVTVDGKPSAHYEHTVAITDGEPELLTVI
ncbi:MAG: type I methionyl aminopeptidase [Tissierellia bacterium]|jgi:methionyl aminopeptidase|nr:type I methionyl aminopeptidase [Tissierellia bacterium]MDD3226399.1 type I methionyl aminopeptidase [Tissierellia bacterium]MDD3750606.1 type I methionyl aminopeptidase [Tissierellia bacterium]MDD4046200.1 type I methionyl aminopeptidase [Tissierellia bacterium]MDD4678560.1 type I methionyl aminopeptidase [Tissierellia bacterium]